jgi:hypothetical protein
MDVYLLPVGQDRYELYCEVPDEPEAPPETEPPKGVLQRLRRRFADMLGSPRTGPPSIVAGSPARRRA